MCYLPLYTLRCINTLIWAKGEDGLQQKGGLEGTEDSAAWQGCEEGIPHDQAPSEQGGGSPVFRDSKDWAVSSHHRDDRNAKIITFA